MRDDHQTLKDGDVVRRYFAKFRRIIAHLGAVTKAAPDWPGPMGEAGKQQIELIAVYLRRLAWTFDALSYKYLMAGHLSQHLPDQLDIDKVESGFPVYRELMQMAVDRAQIDRHLDRLPSAEQLRRQIVDHILRERTPPRRLQYAMSQRVYYERLAKGDLFLAQNDPEIIWLGNVKGNYRRRYLVHWGVYDSARNLPMLYLMILEDTGKTALGHDERRWPAVQNHLVAQSISELKLLTIARGFDADFPDIHPKLFRRIQIGPMRSNAFTRQSGLLAEVLAEADAPPGLDWALSWTVESLISKRTETRSTGLFSSVDTEVYDIDHLDPEAVDAGVTALERGLILPHRAYQVLMHREPAGIPGLQTYVVGDDGVVMAA